MFAFLDERKYRERRQNPGYRRQPEDDAEAVQPAVVPRPYADNRQRRQRTGHGSGGVGRLIKAECSAARGHGNGVSQQRIVQRGS
jgi:hypothetical protein